MYEFAVAPAVSQIRRRGVEVAAVASSGIGAEMEIERGDRIFKVNGRPVRDYVDFRFLTSGETELTLSVRKTNGEDWELEIERQEGEEFGLDFEQIVPRQCANECIFCFCKGNPPEARPSLFIRDEDVRLSFLYGNYTTLTSITEDEMLRVIEQRLSPQYVSVHATDLEIRAYLLGIDKKRADISGKLRRLLDGNIEIHAQVVLCPEINDGLVLRRTIIDLAGLHPGVRSVAIVPLGLTRYNSDPRLRPVTAEFCRRIIWELKPLQRDLRATLGTNFAFLGDEIYLRAGVRLPGPRHYGDYPQIEDGVGMVRSSREAFRRILRKLTSGVHSAHQGLNGTILTGKLFAGTLKEWVERLNERTGTRLHVLPVENRYFGPEIVVAGLMTASDILPLRTQFKGNFVIVPSAAVKSDEPIMLDGVRLDELEQQLSLPVHALDFSSLSRFLTR